MPVSIRPTQRRVTELEAEVERLSAIPAQVLATAVTEHEAIRAEIAVLRDALEAHVADDSRHTGKRQP